jgi:Mg/Co/Ni transporter MgtE
MDTSDPQGKGRIRVYCPDYGDLPGTKVEALPWCRYLSPFGGMVTSDDMTRGPKNSKSSGSVAYGMWAVPKVGAIVAIMCINGDPSRRLFIGCLPPDNAEHTMPHGRYLGEDGDGPFSSTEQPIEPLYSNMKKAFGSDKSKHEFKSRGADSSVTGLTQDSIDRKLTTSGQKDSNTGFKQSRLHPDKKSDATGTTFDSQIYSLTTPGFHSISMDDSVDNGRIRIRTTCGHSIIMDDTNERIYINTAEGNNWIEIDQDGTIDIYAAKSVSINSDTDINLHAKKSIRLDSENIYLNATKNIRGTAKDKIDLSADAINNSGKSKYSVKTKACNLKSKSLSSTATSTSISSAMSLSMTGLATSISGGVSLATSAPMVLASSPTRLYNPLGPLSALTSMATTGASVAGAVNSISGAMSSVSNTLGSVLANMPSVDLGAALNKMDIGDVGRMVSQLDPSELTGMVNNLPTEDLKSIINKLPGDAAGAIMTAMPTDDVFDMFTNMPSFDVGNTLSKLPGEMTSNLIKNMNNEGLGNPLSIIQSGHVGSILNSLPSSDIGGALSSLPVNLINNLKIGDVGSLLQKATNTDDVTTYLPDDILGLSLGHTSQDHASDILSKMTPEQLERVIPHTPTSRVPSNDRYQSIVDRQPLVDMSSIISNIPKIEQSYFPKSRMSRADIGHTFRTMPASSLSNIFTGMNPQHTNMLMQLMHGADIGHVLGNVVDPYGVLRNLDSDVLMNMVSRVPGANFANMFERMEHGDIAAIFDTLGCGGIGNMLSGMHGGDILGTLGMYSNVLTGLPDAIGNALANFPDIAGMLEHTLGNIPNVSEIVSDLMSQIPDVAGMLGGLQAMLMALPVSLHMPPLEIPGLMSLLDMGASALSNFMGVLGGNVAGLMNSLSAVGAASIAGVANAAVSAAGGIVGGVVAEAASLTSMLNTLPSLGMLGSMQGLLGAAVGVAGSTLDLNHLGKMAGSLAAGQLNGMNGVGHLMSCMSGYSAGHVLGHAHPGDLGNLMYAIPNGSMKNVLDRIPNELMGSMMNNMPVDGLSSMLGKMNSNEITGLFNGMDPNIASAVLPKMQGPRKANPGNPEEAGYITRMPGHEPWGRTYSAGEYDRSPKHDYNSPHIGKNGAKRNKNWRR